MFLIYFSDFLLKFCYSCSLARIFKLSFLFYISNIGVTSGFVYIAGSLGEAPFSLKA